MVVAVPRRARLREQHLWSQLDEGTPLHAPPALGAYLLANLRLQVFFTLVPVLMIVGVRDVAAVTFLDHSHRPAATVRSPDRDGRDANREAREVPDEAAEFLIFLASSGLVFVFAPEVLRRVLKTSPLPDGPLRRRLEGLCRRTGMRYRDILVWHTQFNMGNAAVMGVVPWMRYVMLSDLLLERMDDEQVEAVFAHEIGHVIHRHMIWYVVFFLTLVLGAVGPMAVAADWFDRSGLPGQVKQALGVFAGAAGFWLIFGFLSRRFERQANVYAARVIQSVHGHGPSGGRAGAAAFAVAYPALAAAFAPATSPAAPPPDDDSPSHVGRYGATLFASALHRVAVINNIPSSPRSRRDGGVLQRVGYLFGSFMDLAHDWLHGSIPHRMAYLHTLSADPTLTNRFDRVMTRLYCTLLFALFASAAWTGMAMVGTH